MPSLQDRERKTAPRTAKRGEFLTGSQGFRRTGAHFTPGSLPKHRLNPSKSVPQCPPTPPVRLPALGFVCFLLWGQAFQPAAVLLLPWLPSSVLAQKTLTAAAACSRRSILRRASARSAGECRLRVMPS